MITIVRHPLCNEITRPTMSSFVINEAAHDAILTGADGPEQVTQDVLTWGFSMWDGNPSHAPIYVELRIMATGLCALSVPTGCERNALDWVVALVRQAAMTPPIMAI